MPNIYATVHPREMRIHFEQSGVVDVHIAGAPTRRLYVGDRMDITTAHVTEVPVPVGTYALVEAAEALEGKY